ncbi:hypothetical protein C8F01DRAFT_1235749 [Mycena amicta]|nr:hypothetical protein C8F01DRAFT_1235749 [Mycena amicta]
MDGAFMALLRCLPRLTHFALSPSEPLHTISEQLEHILKNCRTLHILVVLYYDRSDPIDVCAAQATSTIGEVPESLRDPRLVLCSYDSELWYEGVLDGPNYWTVAEDFVARKMRREVDGALPVDPPSGHPPPSPCAMKICGESLVVAVAQVSFFFSSEEMGERSECQSLD